MARAAAVVNPYLAALPHSGRLLLGLAVGDGRRPNTPTNAERRPVRGGVGLRLCSLGLGGLLPRTARQQAGEARLAARVLDHLEVTLQNDRLQAGRQFAEIVHGFAPWRKGARLPRKNMHLANLDYRAENEFSADKR